MQSTTEGWVRPATHSPEWTVITWHGLGAYADDLYDLGCIVANILGDEHTTLLGPQAPSRAITLDQMHCPAWCDIVALEEQGLVDIEGLTSHDDRLQAWFQTVHPFMAQTKIVHIGFSQGGAMATTYAHTHGAAGLILLSAYWPDKHWQLSCPILWQHGVDDPVLPYPWAERMQAQLSHLDLTCEAYDCAHHVHPEQIPAIESWCQRSLCYA